MFTHESESARGFKVTGSRAYCKSDNIMETETVQQRVSC